VVSSRWSYGPDGLREREVVHQPLLPRWRDLQPFLLRSAGVVGLVATIMAVVSSDALHIGAEDPAALAAVEPLAPPVVVPAAELNAAPGTAVPEVAVPEPMATAEAEPIAVESDPTAQTTAAPAPIMVTSVSISPGSVPEPNSAPEPIAAPQPNANVAPADEPELVLEPVGVAAAEEALPEAPATPGVPASPTVTAAVERPTSSMPIEPAPPPALTSELRNGTTPASPTSEVATTASVSASAEAMASLSPNADEGPAAEISLSTLRPSDMPQAATSADNFAWLDGAATCPRDWVEAEEGSRSDDAAPDCMTTVSLFAPIAEGDQAALEDAAVEQATILASLPRVPQPRPEPPADFKPSNPHATVRVNSRNSSWPPEPPPNCAAGQRAKWRFVDRKAGTKEWYCR
jgi:hypothetical protein